LKSIKQEIITPTEKKPMSSLTYETIVEMLNTSTSDELQSHATMIRTHLPTHKLGFVFNNAIVFNNLDVVKWLYATFDGLTVSDELFGNACRAGLYEKVEWLLETFPNIDIYKNDCYGFVSAVCRTAEHENYIKIADIILQKCGAKLLECREVRNSLSREIMQGNESIINMMHKYNIKYETCRIEDGALRYQQAIFVKEIVYW
jgi:hypothetical protein